MISSCAKTEQQQQHECRSSLLHEHLVHELSCMIPPEHESSLSIHHDQREVIPAQTTKAKLTTNAYRQKKKKTTELTSLSAYFARHLETKPVYQGPGKPQKWNICTWA